MPGRQRGFTYLALLFAVAIMGVALAAGGTMWSAEQQREREKDLLFIGHQFRTAIRNYYEQSPGTIKRYPMALEDLVKDNRYLGMKRHLRRIYRDPMTGEPTWGLVMAAEGGIMGIYSLSSEKAIKRSGFSLRDEALEGKERYSEWLFVYRPRIDAPSASTTPVLSR